MSSRQRSIRSSPPAVGERRRRKRRRSIHRRPAIGFHSLRFRGFPRCLGVASVNQSINPSIRPSIIKRDQSWSGFSHQNARESSHPSGCRTTESFIGWAGRSPPISQWRGGTSGEAHPKQDNKKSRAKLQSLRPIGTKEKATTTTTKKQTEKKRNDVGERC